MSGMAASGFVFTVEEVRAAVEAGKEKALAWNSCDPPTNIPPEAAKQVVLDALVKLQTFGGARQAHSDEPEAGAVAPPSASRSGEVTAAEHSVGAESSADLPGHQNATTADGFSGAEREARDRAMARTSLRRSTSLMEMWAAGVEFARSVFAPTDEEAVRADQTRRIVERIGIEILNNRDWSGYYGWSADERVYKSWQEVIDLIDREFGSVDAGEGDRDAAR